MPRHTPPPNPRRAIPRASSRRDEAPRLPPSELPETISWWDAFYEVIRRIPRGRVSTYGAVAAMAGHPRAARHVGYALAALKEAGASRDVPWQRVLGSRSRSRAGISIHDPVGAAIQRKMLEAEGVRFDARGTVSLDALGWFETTFTEVAERRGRTKKSLVAKRGVTAGRGERKSKKPPTKGQRALPRASVRAASTRPPRADSAAGRRSRK